MSGFTRFLYATVGIVITAAIFGFLKIEIRAIDILLLYWIIDTNLKIPEKKNKEKR